MNCEYALYFHCLFDVTTGKLQAATMKHYDKLFKVVYVKMFIGGVKSVPSHRVTRNRMKPTTQISSHTWSLDN